MFENGEYWFLGIILIGILISIIGSLTGRNLPQKQKQMRVFKSTAGGLALIAFSLPLFIPYISPFSSIDYLNTLKAENLNSVEDIAKFEQDQTQNIEELKTEIKILRKEIYEMNRFYERITHFLSIVIGIFSFTYAFRKEEKNTE